MLTLGSILALAAAALHVVIFRLESLAWGGAQAQKVFGDQSPQEVAATVLLLSSPAHRAAAVKQGALPMLAVLATAIGLLL